MHRRLSTPSTPCGPNFSTPDMAVSCHRASVQRGRQRPARVLSGHDRPLNGPEIPLQRNCLRQTGCCAQKCSRASLARTVRVCLYDAPERTAVHREGAEMGEGSGTGGALRGCRRIRFAWNALCRGPQNDRQGSEEGDRQGAAPQDARRPRNRQGRFLPAGRLT